jgi:hypothetical protein
MNAEEFERTSEVNVDDIVKTIPIVCSWCDKIYHIKLWTVKPGKPTGVSHGMCPECAKKQQVELEEFLKNKEDIESEI